MAKTYEPIVTVTLPTPATSQSIYFGDIPSTYTDLRIVVSGTTNAQGKVVYLRFNGDTGGNYWTVELSASSASVATSVVDAGTNGIKLNSQGTPLTPYAFLSIADVMNYASSSYKKTVLTQSYELDGTSRGPAHNTGTWVSNSAITSVTIASSSGTFNQIVATIYGIKAA